MAKKIIRRISVLIGGLLALLIVFVVALPTLISTSWGKNLLANFLGKKLEQKVAIDDLSLSWFGSQGLKGLKISDGTDQNVFSCNAIRSPLNPIVGTVRSPTSSGTFGSAPPDFTHSAIRHHIAVRLFANPGS